MLIPASSWKKLWEFLFERGQIGGMATSSPLILAKWADTSNLDKMMRLVEHIDWADKHGNLPKSPPCSQLR